MTHVVKITTTKIHCITFFRTTASCLKRSQDAEKKKNSLALIYLHRDKITMFFFSPQKNFKERQELVNVTEKG